MSFLLTYTGGGSLTYKDAVRVASTASVPLTGATPLVIDGVTLANKDRVLLKDQVPGTDNGIYQVTISGGTYTLTRSSDANTTKEIVTGMIVPVSEGTLNFDKNFQLTTNAPITLGVTVLTFSDSLINKANRDLGNLTSPTAINQSLLFADDTSYNIGAAAASRPQTVYVKSAINLASLTASEILASDADKNVVSLPVATYPSLTELSYVKGVTSSVQGQLAGKANQSLNNLTSPTAVNQVLRGQDGTAAAPAYSFTSDSDTGIYRSADNTLSIACGTLQTGVFSQNQMELTGNSAVYFRFRTNDSFCGIRSANIVGTTTDRIIMNRGENDLALYIGNIADHLLTGSSASESTYSNIGYNIQTINTTQPLRRYYGAWFQQKLSLGDQISAHSPNAGMLAIKQTNTTLQNTQYSPGYPNDTNQVSLETASTPRLGSMALTVRMNVGDTVIFSKTALPNIVTKIVAKTVFTTGNKGFIFTFDQVIPATYSNAAITIRPSPIVVFNNDNTTALEVDYQGNLALGGGVKVKSLHAQAGTANVITVTANDYYIGVDSTLAAKTVNLPAATTVGAGKQYVVKDESGTATTNNISIVASGSDLIDGSASQSLTVNYESVTLVCDGVSKWFII